MALILRLGYLRKGHQGDKRNSIRYLLLHPLVGERLKSREEVRDGDDLAAATDGLVSVLGYGGRILIGRHYSNLGFLS